MNSFCNDNDTYYPINSVCKTDLKTALTFWGEKDLSLDDKYLIGELTDVEMRWIASKMADNFCDCCFWESLRSAFNTLREAKKKKEQDKENIDKSFIKKLEKIDKKGV